MTQAEAMQLAEDHVNLVGKTVKYENRIYSLVRFFVVDKGIGDFRVEVLLKNNDKETKAFLKPFLKAYEMIMSFASVIISLMA
jgi:hypothetical protein